MFHKVSYRYLEEIADKRAETMQHPGEHIMQVAMKVILHQLNIQGPWIKCIVFQDGHVQNVKYHPMPEIPNYICVSATVL